MKNTILALDIGTSNIYAILLALKKEGPEVLLSLSRPSAGMYKGMVKDLPEATKSLATVLSEMEAMVGININRAIVSVGGELATRAAKGMIMVSRADGQISDEDIDRVLKISKASSSNANRHVLHTVPRRYIVDGTAVTNPSDMKGTKLEVDCLVIDAFSQAVHNLDKCLENNDLKIDNYIAGPLASARGSCSKQDQEAGVINIDFGGGTTSFSVFEEDSLIHANVFPVGGCYITKDIAVFLKSSIEIAEQVKLDYGSAFPSKGPKKEIFNLSKYPSGSADEVFSKKELAKVIEARLEESFDFINSDLKQIGKYAKLPAGAVLSGAGAKIPGLLALAKDKLKLPVRMASGEFNGYGENENPAFIKALGLVLTYLDGGESKMVSNRSFIEPVVKFFKNFIP
ncbi:MAG: cell division protein FtsA [Candidatus Parcubacteria bacterium]|nr:cell division protein FtsA [Candidatus Parcubacteria bacterium]